jgi:hypothetical protein
MYGESIISNNSTHSPTHCFNIIKVIIDCIWIIIFSSVLQMNSGQSWSFSASCDVNGTGRQRFSSRDGLAIQTEILKPADVKNVPL